MLRLKSEEAFMLAIGTYCKGLESVSVGCRGQKCEHAITAPELQDLQDAAEAVIDKWEEDKFSSVDRLRLVLADLKDALENRDPDHSCETYFSRTQCDSCGTTLAGDRSEAWGLYRDENDQLQTIQMEICTDCMMYHANGDLPETWADGPDAAGSRDHWNRVNERNRRAAENGHGTG